MNADRLEKMSEGTSAGDAPGGPIPALIIVGFLGSGKTTLMSHLLEQAVARGLAAGLVVNDFDEFSVDGHLLRRQAGGANVLELPGGCMCCQLGDDLADALNTLLAIKRFDWFFIETSGLAEPLEVVHQLTAPALLPSIVPRLMVAVIDIESPVPEQVGPQLVWDQARCSQVVLLNKADQIARDALERAAARIREHSPSADVRITEQARVELGELLARAGELEPPASAAPGRMHVHAAFNSWARRLPEGLDREMFERYLRELPEEIVRAKGFVRFAGDGGSYFFNRIGQWTQVAPMKEGGAPPTMMVCIGQKLSAGELEEEFQRRFPP